MGEPADEALQWGSSAVAGPGSAPPPGAELTTTPVSPLAGVVSLPRSDRARCVESDIRYLYLSDIYIYIYRAPARASPLTSIVADCSDSFV